jgi:hypothetical protein
MPTSDARIQTEHASPYLARLCEHIGKIGNKGLDLLHQRPSHLHGAGRARPDLQAQVEWNGTHGSVSFSWGKITMQASPDTLTVHAEAANEENLQQIQDLVAKRLARFGSREHLKVNWQQLEAPAAAPGEAGSDSRS